MVRSHLDQKLASTEQDAGTCAARPVDGRMPTGRLSPGCSVRPTATGYWPRARRGRPMRWETGLPPRQPRLAVLGWLRVFVASSGRSTPADARPAARYTWCVATPPGDAPPRRRHRPNRVQRALSLVFSVRQCRRWLVQRSSQDRVAGRRLWGAVGELDHSANDRRSLRAIQARSSR